jgi:hypothetical protein
MVAVSEFSWEEVSSPDFGNPARAAWREAVAEIAEKAKATLPQCHGRVDSAVKIVLAGDVELLADGKAKVASQSNGTTQYFVVNGTCECKDFPKAPSGWCKHRIAAGMQKRAAALAKAKLEAATNGQAEPPSQPAPAQGVPVVPSTPLPEVPAIMSTTITVAGRRVEVKLCDTDDARLLVRLQAILAQYPVAPAGETPKTTPVPEDVTPPCRAHGTTLKESTKAPGTYYCPVKDETTGKYCTERWPAKAASR